jgi:cell division protein FtsL
MTVIVLVTVASLFMLVAFHVFAAQSAFTLDKLAKERTNEQLRYERLRDSVARLSAPATVIEEASKLGMQQSEDVQYVSAPPAAPRAAPPGGVPKVDPAKKHLDQSP